VLLKLAWRNIWRNRRRTIISLLALAMGVMAIVALHSFRIATNDEMIRSITRGLVGDLQVHGAGYQDAPEMATMVPDPARVEAEIATALPSARLEQRVLGAGLASAADVATAVLITGIEPDAPGTRGLLAIEQGRGLAPAPGHEAVIGRGLAQELGVGPGGELVVVGQAADGSVANDRFTVVGTADTGSAEGDASAVFLHLADAQELFALEGGVHQIIVRLPDDADPAAAARRLRRSVDVASLEVLPWSEILPELQSAMAAKARNMRLVDVIVFLIVALGVLNTMTMSTFERTRELGVLASLGTRRRRILAMILLETVLLGLLGFAAGVALAFALLQGLGTTHLGGLGGGTDIMGARVPETIRLTVRAAPVASAAVISLLTVVAGGVLPALRASRLKPVEALRHV